MPFLALAELWGTSIEFTSKPLVTRYSTARNDPEPAAQCSAEDPRSSVHLSSSFGIAINSSKRSFFAECIAFILITSLRQKEYAQASTNL
jgi:hypothetical protein